MKTNKKVNTNAKKRLWSGCACTMLAMSMVTTSILPVSAATTEATTEGVVLGESGTVSEQTGLRFDSVNSEYAVTTEAVEIPDTIEVWVKLDSNENRRQIIMNNYLNGSETSFGIEVTAKNNLRYWERTPEKGQISCLFDSGANQIPICNDEWTLITIVRNKAENKVMAYINGEFVASMDAKVSFSDTTSTYPMHFATDLRQDNKRLDGSIGEVRFWNDERTAEEIKEYASKEVTGTEEGLAHAWKFEEPEVITEAMTFADKVENGISVVAKGYKIDLPDVEISKRDFDINGSIDFENSSVQFATEKKLTDVPHTFEAIVKLPKDLEGNGGVICGNYMDAGYYDYDLPYVTFSVNENGNPCLTWNINWSRDDASRARSLTVEATNVDLRTDEWVHVAMSYDEAANKAYCYINGEKVYEMSDCDFVTDVPAQALKIGGDYRTNNTEYFKGEIAYVRAWSDARSEEDIKANMETLTTEKDTLLGAWTFDETTDGAYVDQSQNGNNVTAFQDWIDGDIAEGDYSFVVLPDTQFLAEAFPEKYEKLTQWIVDNKEKYNIEAVMHLGDITNVNTTAQWTNAQNAMNILDDEVAYIPMTGNHDNVTSFNKYFSYEKFSQKDYFGGAMEEGRTENAYYFIEAGGRRYMIVALTFAPSDKVVEWANEVIDAEVAKDPDLNVIVNTHAYMNWDGDFLAEDDWDHASKYVSGANNGDDIYNKIVKNHSNVILCMGGHIGFPDLAVRTDEQTDGHEVVSMLCDSQGMDYPNGGLGMAMVLTFHEDSDEVNVNWISTDSEKLYRERNQFTIELQHVTSAPEVGTVLTTDDATYKVTTAGVENGTCSGIIQL